eukprot:2751779-Alexandrium_andersonii.AAC.1
MRALCASFEYSCFLAATGLAPKHAGSRAPHPTRGCSTCKATANVASHSAHSASADLGMRPVPARSLEHQ